MLTLSFHGAARTVTGSRHLLETDHGTVLVDAGMFQGLKKLRLLNWSEPTFAPRRVDHLLLTHTHIDHAGYLPRLIREGYRGKVHCTSGTRDLARVLLLDAAKIQEEDAEHANRRGWSKHRPALPLFTTEEAEKALGRLRATEYDEWLPLAPGLRARFRNAGHILGSASVEVGIARNGGESTVVFSGDVGRWSMPLHHDPVPPPACDWLVLESTYGNRLHGDESFLDQIRKPFRRTFSKGGTVLVPAFAVGRSQLVTLILREAMERGDLPQVPIHIDSPMAVDATKLYGKHLVHDCLDEHLTDDGRRRLFPGKVELHSTRDDSMRLNALPGPRIIISASGMLAGGRVLHHLRRLLPDERNLVVLVGYQALGTRGRALQEGKSHLKMHGRNIPVRAAFVSVNGLSAHADRDGLLRYVRGAERAPRGIFVVHGEPDSATALAGLLRKEIGSEVHVPEMEERFELDGGAS